MKDIKTSDSHIVFGTRGYRALEAFLADSATEGIVVITDENTHRHCFDRFASKLNFSGRMTPLAIPAGEMHKTVPTCQKLWSELSEKKIDRHAMIVNLGGGVTTDLGGFVAATWLRGLTYINIPTSLLAMVDASVGGKTGVNFNGIKNQVGLINAPKMVLIDPEYLRTLPKAEFNSGVAEMLKHGLVASPEHWRRLTEKKLTLSHPGLPELIRDSISIKKNVVERDPLEKNLRKILNFGHTFGHAIETYFLSGDKNTVPLHGEAVAAGMIMAGWLSNKLLGFPEEALTDLVKEVDSCFDRIEIDEEAQTDIVELIGHDKKTKSGQPRFVLLENIGTPKTDCAASDRHIREAIRFYEP